MKENKSVFLRVLFVFTFVMQAISALIVFGTVTSIVISIVISIIITIVAGLFVTYKTFEDKMAMTQILASCSFLLCSLFLILYVLIVIQE